MAVTETGNSLRDGVEAGIQAANEQLYQGGERVIESTRSAGQEFTQQFQGWAGTTAQQAQASNPFSTSPQTTSTSTSGRRQVSNPFATAPPAASAPASPTARTRSGVAPPPWAAGAATDETDWSADSSFQNTSPRTAALGTVATQTESGWTSISSTIAPPAMQPPRLVNTPIAAAPVSIEPIGSAPLQPMVGNNGPGFPAAITANQSVDRSLLAQPHQPAATVPANENFEIGWGNNSAAPPAQQATIGGRYDTNASNSRQDLLPDRDFGVGTPPVAVQSPAQQAATPGSDPWAEKDPWGDDRLKQPVAAAATPIVQPVVANPAAGSAAAIQPAPVQGPAGEQVPWAPLLFVSLTLAGSIGANLFLGWSYMDARQKYRHLVQKTANKFRRATAAA
jgi:hypothetical protein